MHTQTAALIDGVLLLFVLVPITAADIREQRVPDRWVVVGFLLILSRRLLLPSGIGGITASCPGALFSAPRGMWWLIHAVVGLLFILAVRFVSKGKIGVGDAKLSALIAFSLGIGGWILALLLASLAAIVFAAVRIARGVMSREDRIPFAPFLGAGAAAGLAAGVLWDAGVLWERVGHAVA